MKSESCAHCAERDELTVLDVSIAGTPETLHAVVCIKCGAQGPKRDTIDGAMAAWKHRVLDMQIGDDKFVVMWGYEKYMLTLEQITRWHEVVRGDGTMVYNRVIEQRRLLQEWGLMPPSKLVQEEGAGLPSGEDRTRRR